MFRILCLCVALLLAPLTAQADVISKPEKSGPVRLVCMNPDGLRAHLEKLTRNQIIGVRFAARNGQIKWPCSDVQLPVGTVLVHGRWIQTKDRWWVMAQTVRYPNGSRWVTVDPMQATYHQVPIQWRCYYLDYCTPIINRRDRDRYDRYDHDDRRGHYGRDDRSHRDDTTIEEGQRRIQRQLKALKNK